jgi:hypothetical protein
MLKKAVHGWIRHKGEDNFPERLLTKIIYTITAKPGNIR